MSIPITENERKTEKEKEERKEGRKEGKERERKKEEKNLELGCGSSGTTPAYQVQGPGFKTQCQ
jgi:hypothetical protein